MGWIYRNCLQPLLFLQESEAAHNRVIGGLSWAGRLPLVPMLADAVYGAPDLPVTLGGLRFPNPIGLAAGMDKHAAAVPMWERLGFGFAELGGVTQYAQPGNDPPRMFRAVNEGALVNRMGFNNPGAEAVAQALQQWRARDQWPTHPIGINLGKSKVTPLEEAAEDYAFSFRTLQGLADFFVVNVSSPNTPNLRQLQDKSALDDILKALRAVNSKFRCSSRSRPTSLMKRSTMCSSWPRPIRSPELWLPTPPSNAPSPATCNAALPMSKPAALAAHHCARAARRSSRTFISTPKASCRSSAWVVFSRPTIAWEKITAGASLLQVYTGLVYEGPAIAGDLVRGLKARMEKEGVRSLADVIGQS